MAKKEEKKRQEAQHDSHHSGDGGRRTAARLRYPSRCRCEVAVAQRLTVR